MRAVGPSWGFFAVGTVLVAFGVVCAVRPELAWRWRKVRDEDSRDRPPTATGLLILRVIGAALALAGIFAVVAALLR